jgi:hypothetical protein
MEPRESSLYSGWFAGNRMYGRCLCPATLTGRTSAAPARGRAGCSPARPHQVVLSYRSDISLVPSNRLYHSDYMYLYYWNLWHYSNYGHHAPVKLFVRLGTLVPSNNSFFYKTGQRLVPIKPTVLYSLRQVVHLCFCHSTILMHSFYSIGTIGIFTMKKCVRFTTCELRKRIVSFKYFAPFKPLLKI